MNNLNKFKVFSFIALLILCVQFCPCKFESNNNAISENEEISIFKDPEFNYENKTNLKGKIGCNVIIKVGGKDREESYVTNRNKLKEKNKTKNHIFFKRLKLFDYESYYCSSFAPFIEIQYSSEKIFQLRDEKRISQVCEETESYYEKIDSYLNENSNAEYALIKPENASYYPYERALADVGISYSDKDLTRNRGKGVKIGILENKLPDNTSNFPYASYYGKEVDVHPTIVSSIAAGKYGIASESSLYFVSKESCLSRFQSIDLMISNGVNVINHSGGFSPNPNAYNIYTSYIDYIVKYTGCIFVNAAGNIDLNNKFFPNPSYGLNVISVGSCDRKLNPSTFNCTEIDNERCYDSIIKKPNLFAPGDHIFGIKNISDGSDYNDYITGTSYSAPIVTGIIALLMSEFPELKTNPGKLISVITTSCTKMKNQVEDYDNIHGFGIINYQRARIAYLNSFSVSSKRLNDCIFQKSFILSPNEEFVISCQSLYDGSNDMNQTVIDIDYISYIIPEISLFNDKKEIITKSINYGNFSYIKYINESLKPINLYFEIYTKNFLDFIDTFQTISWSFLFSNDIPDISLSIHNNYLDVCPTFNWSINTNKQIDNVDMFIVNYCGQDICNFLNINSKNNLVDLSSTCWANILELRGKEYYTFIKIIFSDGLTYYSKVFSLEEPNRYKRLIQILPKHFGIEGQYFFDEREKVIKIDDININTKRLRCGYIENQYIVLSPKRTGAGKAYLQIEFDVNVFSLLVGLAWWSNKENVYADNGDKYSLEYKDINNEWIEWLDLLNDVNITTDRECIDRFILSDYNGIKGVRLVCVSPITNSNRNKGRICIDDIVINQNQSFGFISQYYEAVF